VADVDDLLWVFKAEATVEQIVARRDVLSRKT